MENQLNPTKVFEYVPFERNSILRLVLFIASAYILLHITIVLFIILSDAEKNAYQNYILPNVGIIDWQTWVQKPWTLFTYCLWQKSFFTLLTNMVWLYIFGSVVQQQTSHKEVFTMFFVTYIVSGFIFLALSGITKAQNSIFILNSMPAVTSFALGSLALQWNRRLEFGIPWKIPLWMLVILFLILVVLTSGSFNSFSWMIYIVSICIGIFYGMGLRFGWQPGTYIYNKIQSLQQSIAGSDDKIDGWRIDKFEKELRANNPDLEESEIESILSKLSRGGMGALSLRERSYLFRSK